MKKKAVGKDRPLKNQLARLNAKKNNRPKITADLSTQ